MITWTNVSIFGYFPLLSPNDLFLVSIRGQCLSTSLDWAFWQRTTWEKGQRWGNGFSSVNHTCCCIQLMVSFCRSQRASFYLWYQLACLCLKLRWSWKLPLCGVHNVSLVERRFRTTEDLWSGHFLLGTMLAFSTLASEMMWGNLFKPFFLFLSLASPKWSAFIGDTLF